MPVSALIEAARALFKPTSEKDLVVTTVEINFYAQGGGQPSNSGTIRAQCGSFTLLPRLIHRRRKARSQFTHPHGGPHCRSCCPSSRIFVTELQAHHYPDSVFVDFQGLIDSKHMEATQAKADEFVRKAMPIKIYWWKEDELREKCAVVPAAVEFLRETLCVQLILKVLARIPATQARWANCRSAESARYLTISARQAWWM